MVTPELGRNYMRAGHELTSALQGLGFDMDAVFWGYDSEDERHVLAVVTDVFDAQGPLEISKQLFKAYNASLTPKEISPFVVRLLSTNQVVAKDILKVVNNNWKMQRYSITTPYTSIIDKSAKGETVTIEETISGTLAVKPEWVIMSKGFHKTRKTVEINRRWHSFKRHIDERIAA